MAKTLKTTITLYGKQDKSLQAAFKAAQQGGAGTADKIGSMFKKAAAVASAAFAAIKIGDFMSDAMDTYAGFEQAMANTAAIAGASGEDYEMLSKAARDAGKATAFTAEQAADALGYMSLAGWDAKTSTEALMPVLKMAEATQADLATTSDLVTDSMSAMGLGVDELNDYMDVLITTNNKANTTAGALMEAMIGAGGAMRAAGIDVKDTATAFGMLANNGVKGAQAGTALNSMVARLTTHSKALGTAAKLGVDVFDQQTGQFRGLEAVLTDLNSALSQYSQEEQLAFKKQLAGANYFSQFGYLLDSVKEGYYDLSAAQEAMTARGLDASKLMSQMPSIFGNMDDAARQAMDSIGAMYKFEDSDELLDTETILRQVADSLYDYSDAEREAYLQAIAGQEHYDELKGVIDSMYDTLDMNTSAWGKLRDEVENSGGSLDEMWKTATDTLSYAKEVWNSAVSDFKIGIAEAFGPKLKSILNKASERFPKITENVSKLIEKIPFDAWADKVGGMVDVAFDFFDSLTSGKSIIDSVADSITGMMISSERGELFGNWELQQKVQDVRDFASAVGSELTGAWDKIKEVGSWLKDTFIQAISNAKEEIEKHGPSLEKLKKLWDNVKRVAGDMLGAIQKGFEDLTGESGGATTLIGLLATLADSAVDVLNAFLEWEGAVPTIITIATAIAGIKVGVGVVASVKALGAAFSFLKVSIAGANIAGQAAGIAAGIKSAFLTAQTGIYVFWTDKLLPMLSSMGTALSGAAASVGSFLTADIGATMAAGGAAAGATVATAIVGGIVAAIAGLEVGKTIGSMIFPDDAALYEQYSGIEGSFQMLMDFFVSVKDFFVMLGEDIGAAFAAMGEAISAKWEEIISAVSTKWEELQTGFNEMITFISTTFKEGWDSAWESIVSSFTAIFGKIVSAAASIVNSAIDVINGIIGGINSVADVAGLGKIELIQHVSWGAARKMALGGTVNTPTYALIGEAGYPETVVPHTDTPRSRALLAEAATGVTGGRVTTTGNYNFTYAPTINGASGNIAPQLRESFEDFKAQLDKYFSEKEREAFA